MRYLILLLLVACNTTSIKLPDIEDCRMLTNSILCVDARINKKSVDVYIGKVRSNINLSQDDKEDIIAYFEDNREEIVKSKTYELSLRYHRYFLGYGLNPQNDRDILYKEVMERFKELELLRQQCPTRSGKE